MYRSEIIWFLLILTNFGLAVCRGLASEETAPPLRVQQCREGCLEKFALENMDCMKRPECAAMDLSDKLNNYIPEALRFLCWDQCRNPPPPKTRKLIPGAWPLHVAAMTRQGSLVSVDVAWEPKIFTDQCLITWEVSGGGLMGNLLTDSFKVELSLWPETHYDLQVTCENKKSGSMTRSLPLKINTSDAIQLIRIGSSEKIIEPSTATNRRNRIFEDNFDLINELNSIMDTHHVDAPNVIHSKIVSNPSADDDSAVSIWRLSQVHKEFIFGAVASILAFFIIIFAAFLINRSRDISNNRIQSLFSDKQILIDNEITAETVSAADIRTLHV